MPRSPTTGIDYGDTPCSRQVTHVCKPVKPMTDAERCVALHALIAKMEAITIKRLDIIAQMTALLREQGEFIDKQTLRLKELEGLKKMYWSMESSPQRWEA